MEKISLAAEQLFSFYGFTITNSMLASLLVSFLIVLGFLVLRFSIKIVPRGIYNAIEAVLEYLYQTFAQILESKDLAREFFPLLSTLFIFIVINNWFGLVPGVGTIFWHQTPLLRGGNADLNTTISLAIVSVGATSYYGIKHAKLDYLKKFFNFKNPIFTFIGILELISEFAKIISFSFRLFGNIFAGEVLMLVVGFLVPIIAPLPFLGLEIFVGLIQGVVFMMLTLVFLKIATAGH